MLRAVAALLVFVSLPSFAAQLYERPRGSQFGVVPEGVALPLEGKLGIVVGFPQRAIQLVASEEYIGGRYAMDARYRRVAYAYEKRAETGKAPLVPHGDFPGAYATGGGGGLVPLLIQVYATESLSKRLVERVGGMWYERPWETLLVAAAREKLGTLASGGVAVVTADARETLPQDVTHTLVLLANHEFSLDARRLVVYVNASLCPGRHVSIYRCEPIYENELAFHAVPDENKRRASARKHVALWSALGADGLDARVGDALRGALAMLSYDVTDRGTERKRRRNSLTGTPGTIVKVADGRRWIRIYHGGALHSVSANDAKTDATRGRDF